VKLSKGDTTEAAIKRLQQLIDASKDGKIQRDEFIAYFEELLKDKTDKQFKERIDLTIKFLERKPQLLQIFQQFDTDNSGSLSKSEIYEMVKLTEKAFSEDDFAALLKKLDLDGNNEVDVHEFVDYYFHQLHHLSDADFNARCELTLLGRRKLKLVLLFNMWDKNHDGRLDLNELADLLRLNGGKWVSPDDIIDTLVKMDANKDKKVDQKEWLAYMTQLCALMDDHKFNKAFQSMANAAQPAKK